LRIFQPAGEELELTGDVAAVDGYVIALGRAGIAVRSLEVRARSLESLFLDLTGNGGTEASALAMPPRVGEESDQEPVTS
jgi:ABC-2 type transport system ATP-binding protein